MDTKKEYSRISIVIDKVFSKEVLTVLKDMGISYLNLETGRGMLLKKSEGLKKLFSTKTSTVEDPVNTFVFFVEPDQARPAMQYLATKLQIEVPGKGSIYAKQVTLEATSLDRPHGALSIPAYDTKVIATNLTGICCITQKGEAGSVAEIGLNTGTAVPTITYGIGTGLRNRLGIWRILIPAEKEITTIIVDSSDAETVMDMMISAGQIDQPGKGFIYTYPIEAGILNTKFFYGDTNQAASIEQIVSAIDEIKGTTEWRKKTLSSGGTFKSRKFLTGLVNFSLICNEGHGEPLTKVAMAAGAAGATISLTKHIQLDEASTLASPAREKSVMTIGEKQVPTILAALEEAGLLGKDAAGEIHISPVPKACTFLGK